MISFLQSLYNAIFFYLKTLLVLQKTYRETLREFHYVLWKFEDTSHIKKRNINIFVLPIKHKILVVFTYKFTLVNGN